MHCLHLPPYSPDIVQSSSQMLVPQKMHAHWSFHCNRWLDSRFYATLEGSSNTQGLVPRPVNEYGPAKAMCIDNNVAASGGTTAASMLSWMAAAPPEACPQPCP